MPSLSSVSSTAPPTLPCSGSTEMIDLALSSVRLTASGVEMSGFGAPFLTAIARRILAITVALLGTMLPVLQRFGKRREEERNILRLAGRDVLARADAGAVGDFHLDAALRFEVGGQLVDGRFDRIRRQQRDLGLRQRTGRRPASGPSTANSDCRYFMARDDTPAVSRSSTPSLAPFVDAIASRVESSAAMHNETGDHLRRSAQRVIADLRELAARTSTPDGAQRLAWGPVWRERATGCGTSCRRSDSRRCRMPPATTG